MKIYRPVFGWLFLLIVAVSLACAEVSTPAPSTPAASATGEPPEPASGWVELYFTDPNGPQAQSLRGGPDKAVAEAIRAARVSVDAAIYQLDLWSIRDALLDAHRRGLSVRVVTETDNLGEEEMQALIEAGIQVVDDQKDGLMHNKFVVIDRQEVWTGSMNFTINDAYKNNNNLLRFRSTKLAQDYTTEFEEMFLDEQFAAGSPANTPYPDFTLNGVRLQVFFSPDDGAQARLVELIDAAQESISFMAFSFTSDEIGGAMIERAGAGVTVEGVMERRQYESNAGTEYDYFQTAAQDAQALDVRLDGNPRTMHHKVIIIDGKIVITGSYNFTFSAENRNDENLLIFYNPDLAALFVQEFQRVFGEAGQ